MSYIISDKASGFAAAIDPTFSLAGSHQADVSVVTTQINYINTHNLTLQWILETHTQHSHCSASQYLKEMSGGDIGISKFIQRVPAARASLCLVKGETIRSTGGYDYFFDDGEVINLGHIPICVLLTPGLSLASACYQIGDMMFTGDALISLTNAYRQNQAININGLGWQSLQKLLQQRINLRLFNGFTHAKRGDNLPDWESSVYQERYRFLHARQN